VNVAVGLCVGLAVAVGLCVAVSVGVALGVSVAVAVAVSVGVLVGDGVGVSVGVAVEVGVNDGIGLGVGVIPAGRLKGEYAEGVRSFAFGNPPVSRRVVLIERPNYERGDLSEVIYSELKRLTDDSAS